MPNKQFKNSLIPTTVQPLHAGVQPSHASVQLLHNIVQLLHNTVQLIHNTVQPLHSTVQPLHNIVQLLHNTVQPLHNTVEQQKPRFLSKNQGGMIFLFVLLTCWTIPSFAQKKLPNEILNKPVNAQKVAAGCTPANSFGELNINNVRTRIYSDGQNWYNRSTGWAYEVPKVPAGQIAVHSLYAGSIWVGGFDANKNLKTACQTYRYPGTQTDFWPGPLDKDGAIDAITCNQFDQVWSDSLKHTESFLADAADGKFDEEIPYSISNWPSKGNPNLSFVGKYNLAPFFDADGDGIYNPGNIVFKKDTGSGISSYVVDYPVLDPLYPDARPDQMLYTIFNDVGNIHTQSGGDPIGLEVHQLSFAFIANNDLNSTTFYKYTFINKATTDLDSVFMADWMETDLGDYSDDYVGCDTTRSLGILYNGDADDGPGGGIPNYGNQPPILGNDFFQGPTADLNDGKDNDHDGTIDEAGETIAMSSFNYCNWALGPQGQPVIASQYYGYLTGTWADGTPFTCGGDGHGGSKNCKFMFPDDPKNSGGWSECSAGNSSGDRQTVQSAGPFTLKPGAINEIVTGIVWVRPPVGTYPCPSFAPLLRADDIAQVLFDNHFQLIRGPDAPTVTITELDREIILSITEYKKTEDYKKVDPVLAISLKGIGSKDSFYIFQGYKIYQLKSNLISNADLQNPDNIEGKAKLLFTVDIKDTITSLTNFAVNSQTGLFEGKIMVTGTNSGIRHTFRITSDEFSSGDRGLVNYNSYYYLVVPYAYNRFRAFTPTLPDTLAQLVEYLEGGSVRISAIPHKSFSNVRSGYKDGFEITRLGGTGNGGNELNLSAATVSKILKSPDYSTDILKYQKGKGPVNVYVYDPLKVPANNFELFILDSVPNSKLDKNAYWMLINTTTKDTVFSVETIEKDNEQLLVVPQKNIDWGMAVNIKQTKNPGADLETRINGNGVITSSVEYADPSKKWLSGVIQDDGSDIGFVEFQGDLYYKWIMSGTNTNAPVDYSDTKGWLDSLEFFEKIINGTWAPYRMCRNEANAASGPAWSDDNHLKSKDLQLDSLASVDIVFTPDKSKWTQSVVIELGDNSINNERQQIVYNLRNHLSLNLDGTYAAPGDTGRSWFPGYAINLETGVRLNIMFGEDSDIEDTIHPRDLIWNPTDEILKPSGNPSPAGKHYIYVLKTRYDSCNAVHKSLTTPSTSSSATEKRKVYQQVMWVSMPYLAKGFKLKSYTEGLIPNEATVKLRVQKPYKEYITATDTLPHYSFSTIGSDLDKSTDVLKNKLDTINIVPSPYYAYSEYETDQADNRIRITNLPQKCVITIYTQNGLLVRQLKKDNDSPYEEWDLKNKAGVPISSGVYIFYIKAEGIGEKVLKWFGVMRPIDLDTF